VWGLLIAVAAVAFLATRGGAAPQTPKLSPDQDFADALGPGSVTGISLDPGRTVHLAYSDPKTGDSLDVVATVRSYDPSTDRVNVTLGRAVGPYKIGDAIAVMRRKVWSVDARSAKFAALSGGFTPAPGWIVVGWGYTGDGEHEAVKILNVPTGDVQCLAFPDTEGPPSVFDCKDFVDYLEGH
jgi:hypothetical protein